MNDKVDVEETEGTEGTEGTDAKTGSVMTKKEGYVATKTAKGTKSFSCGDEIAEMLDGKDLEDVYALAAEKLGCEEQELREKYAHLNHGMQRMSLGNRIRGAIAKVKRDEEKAKAKAEKEAAKSEAEGTEAA